MEQGLCEDCAVCCGRCGIVLCRRDSKFAVDCDTCKMSYCLVCLVSNEMNFLIFTNDFFVFIDILTFNL